MHAIHEKHVDHEKQYDFILHQTNGVYVLRYLILWSGNKPARIFIHHTIHYTKRLVPACGIYCTAETFFWTVPYNRHVSKIGRQYIFPLSCHVGIFKMTGYLPIRLKYECMVFDMYICSRLLLMCITSYILFVSYEIHAQNIPTSTFSCKSVVFRRHLTHLRKS